MKNLHVRITDEVWDKISPAADIFGVKRVTERIMSFVGNLDKESNSVVGNIMTAIAMDDEPRALKLIGEIYADIQE